MSELDNRVAITVAIADSTATRAGFGTLAIIHEHEFGGDRVLTYTDLTGLLVDFPANTPVGRYASQFFSQAFVAEKIKVIEKLSGDANYTAALTAAAVIDNDWYGIGMPSNVLADQNEICAYALANTKIAFNTIDDAVAVATGTTDLGSVQQALSNNRAATWYSSTRGSEFFPTGIVVSGTTATATVPTGTGPAVGDTVGIWGSAVSALNSTWTVTVSTATTFQFTVPSGTATDSAASQGWTTLNMIDSAATGKMLPQDAGSRTWDLQELAAVTADALTGTEQTNLGGKNINWFSTVAGKNVTGGLKSNGGGGKLASGRYLDVQRGADWLESNLQVDLFELMINSGGDLGYDALGFQKVESTIAIRLNDGLDKGFLTPFVSGQYSGLDWFISMPDISAIPASDKTSRLLAGINIYANIRGKIHNLEAAITLST